MLASWPVGRWFAEIIFLDFVIYWQHRCFHTIPTLWRYHSVHHTDPDLDVTSASRFHLGEVVLSAILKLIVAVALGISVAGVAAFEIVLLIAAQFQHSNIALPSTVTKLLWYVLVPPEMHRVHHCPRRIHHDANYGTILTLWDWLFGTLFWPRRHAAMFGLAEARDRLGLWALLCRPFRQ
jgi:sterol desaturase/sphingolipid hydroxylase (fatty acid hydroxylase superfamily)